MKTRFKDIQKAEIDYLVDVLTEEGEKAIRKAVATKTYEHQTYNLHDSYGSAVYVNGAIRFNSIRTLQPKATVMKKWYNTYMYGQNAIMDYLISLKPAQKGITLVVAAAMPYASVLEEGKVTHKYKVISGARADLEKVAKKYKGELKQI